MSEPKANIDYVHMINEKIKENNELRLAGLSFIESADKEIDRLKEQLKEANELLEYLDGRFRSRPYGYLNNMNKFEVKGFEDIISEYLDKYGK